MNNLKHLLIEQARQSGICDEGLARMRSLDLPGLIAYFLENPDWCLERGFPSVYLLSRMDRDTLADSGIFIDRKFKGELLSSRQVYVFLNCRGTVKTGLNIPLSVIPMLYFANSCRMRIVGTGDVRPRCESQRTEIPLYSFGPNEISARDNIYVKFNRFKTELL